jgi:hypothetical protein
MKPPMRMASATTSSNGLNVSTGAKSFVGGCNSAQLTGALIARSDTLRTPYFRLAPRAFSEMNA